MPLFADGDIIVNVLWTGENWHVEDIYGKKMIGKFNVDALFLQFIAAGIIKLKILKYINTGPWKYY